MWLGGVGARTLYIEPGAPWENGYVESFNGKPRDELLGREVFYTLLEVQVLTEEYRQTYNHIRPHCSSVYQPPVPERKSPQNSQIRADEQARSRSTHSAAECPAQGLGRGWIGRVWSRVSGLRLCNISVLTAHQRPEGRRRSPPDHLGWRIDPIP